MVSGFERSTAVRIPKNDVKTYHDFVSRDPAFENSDKSLAVVVHKSNKSKGAADGEAMDVDVVAEEGASAEEVEGAENGEELLAEEGTFVVHHGRQLGAGGGEHEEAEELHQEEGGRGPAKVRHEFVVAGDGEDGTRRKDVASAHDEHHRVARDGDSLDVLGRGHFFCTMRGLNCAPAVE
mgnify:CR=1 FL=1